MTPVEVPSSVAKVDIELHLGRKKGGVMAGSLLFNSDIFDYDVMSHFAKRFGVLLVSFLDGYDEDNYVHMNLGWGGYSTGYYSLENISAGGDLYNSSELCVLCVSSVKLQFWIRNRDPR